MKKIFIWGIGEYGNLLYESIQADLCEVIGAIDSDREKQRRDWRGHIQVYAPEYLRLAQYDQVVIAVLHYVPILEKCKELDISFDKILVLFKDWEKIDFIDRKLRYIFKLKREIANINWKNEIRWNNAPYEFGIYKSPVIRSATELLQKLIKEKSSLCRFGDGELELMREKTRPWFQKVDHVLAIRLREVFYSDREEILIAVSDDFGNLDHYTQSAADEIRAYLTRDTRKELMELLGTERDYFDAYVSRPYLMYKDKGHAVEIFSLLKVLWDKRDVLLVEGEYTRSGVGNDLFRNVKRLSRIICPHANAFDRYAEILECIKKSAQKDTLVLLCLGPTATVLAYDISLTGIQAVDIGQIDNEYEWFLNKAAKRMDIKGKAVPELNEKRVAEECLDQEYISQIIARI